MIELILLAILLAILSPPLSVTLIVGVVVYLIGVRVHDWIVREFRLGRRE